MRYLLIFVLISFNISISQGQTVIEMMYPGDANLVLLEVHNKKDADVIVYKTEDKMEAESWDLMWKFRKWGFSNFSVYLAQSPDDSLLVDKEEGITYPLQGKIYFTNNPNERGYQNPSFHLEGVFRKVKKEKK